MTRSALAQRASAMRAAPTPAEDALHKALNARGIPHRRQPCIGGFIPDFALKNKVLVELDGYHHFTKQGKAYDAKRTASLSRKGYKVLRFPNGLVFSDPERVCLIIIAATMKRRPRVAR